MIFDNTLGKISDMIKALEEVKAAVGDVTVVGDSDTANRLRISTLKEDNTSAYEHKDAVKAYIEIF